MSNIALITTLLERTIAYHPVFRDVAGSTVGGLFLSQAYYWSTGGRIASERAGWFYKTGAEWLQETRLSRSEQDRARRDLRKVGLLEEKRRGNPAKMFYRLNLERLFELIEAQATGKPAQKKPKKINSMQDSAISVQPEEKPNKNNSMQNPAITVQPEQVKPAISEENSIETTDCRIPQTRLQNPANKNAESCNLNNTESTTENTTENTYNDVGSAKGSADVFASPNPADTRKRIPMTLDWRPSEKFKARARTRGIVLSRFTEAQLTDCLGEFVCYWEARSESGAMTLPAAEWENKYVQRLKAIQVGGAQGVHNGNASNQGYSTKPKSGAAILAEGCASAFDGF